MSTDASIDNFFKKENFMQTFEKKIKKIIKFQAKKDTSDLITPEEKFFSQIKNECEQIIGNSYDCDQKNKNISYKDLKKRIKTDLEDLSTSKKYLKHDQYLNFKTSSASNTLSTKKINKFKNKRLVLLRNSSNISSDTNQTSNKKEQNININTNNESQNLYFNDFDQSIINNMNKLMVNYLAHEQLKKNDPGQVQYLQLLAENLAQVNQQMSEHAKQKINDEKIDNKSDLLKDKYFINNSQHTFFHNENYVSHLGNEVCNREEKKKFSETNQYQNDQNILNLNNSTAQLNQNFQDLQNLQSGTYLELDNYKQEKRNSSMDYPNEGINSMIKQNSVSDQCEIIDPSEANIKCNDNLKKMQGWNEKSEELKLENAYKLPNTNQENTQKPQLNQSQQSAGIFRKESAGIFKKESFAEKKERMNNKFSYENNNNYNNDIDSQNQKLFMKLYNFLLEVNDNNSEYINKKNNGKIDTELELDGSLSENECVDTNRKIQKKYGKSIDNSDMKYTNNRIKTTGHSRLQKNYSVDATLEKQELDNAVDRQMHNSMNSPQIKQKVSNYPEYFIDNNQEMNFTYRNSKKIYKPPRDPPAIIYTKSYKENRDEYRTRRTEKVEKELKDKEVHDDISQLVSNLIDEIENANKG